VSLKKRLLKSLKEYLFAEEFIKVIGHQVRIALLQQIIQTQDPNLIFEFFIEIKKHTDSCMLPEFYSLMINSGIDASIKIVSKEMMDNKTTDVNSITLLFNYFSKTSNSYYLSIVDKILASNRILNLDPNLAIEIYKNAFSYLCCQANKPPNEASKAILVLEREHQKLKNTSKFIKTPHSMLFNILLKAYYKNASLYISKIAFNISLRPNDIDVSIYLEVFDKLVGKIDQKNALFACLAMTPFLNLASKKEWKEKIDKEDPKLLISVNEKIALLVNELAPFLEYIRSNTLYELGATLHKSGGDASIIKKFGDAQLKQLQSNIQNIQMNEFTISELYLTFEDLLPFCVTFQSKKGIDALSLFFKKAALAVDRAALQSFSRLFNITVKSKLFEKHENEKITIYKDLMKALIESQYVQIELAFAVFLDLKKQLINTKHLNVLIDISFALFEKLLTGSTVANENQYLLYFDFVNKLFLTDPGASSHLEDKLKLILKTLTKVNDGKIEFSSLNKSSFVSIFRSFDAFVKRLEVAKNDDYIRYSVTIQLIYRHMVRYQAAHK